MDANNMDVSDSLISAVRQGKLKRVRELINCYGLSYSQAWSEGYVLLCDAVKYKHAAVAKLLLTSGAKVNSKTLKHINTPLHFACKNGDVKIVKMLLDKGANVNVKNHIGRTPLHNAIQNKKMEVTQILLNNGADVNCICTTTREKGYTPLLLAVENGFKEVVTLLLSRGAHVNVKGEDGITPLHIAAYKGYIDIAEDLLKHGACIHSFALKEGYTPLHFAAKTGHETVVKLLLQHGAKVDNQDKDGKTTLHLAVEKGCLTIVEDILRYSPDINHKSNRSSIKIAVLGYGEEYAMIVEVLLEYGFTVDPEDANNTELLHTAVEKEHLKIIEHLLKYDADVNTSHHGCTLLHIAARFKQEEVAKLLLSCGAVVNAHDQNGTTPIVYAIQNADLKMTNLLFTYGASIKDSPDLLHIAVMMECIEIVVTLLQHDADIYACDKFGRTALHCTALSEYQDRDINSKGEIAELLLSKGARVDAKTINGVTTLHAAIKKGFVKVVEALLKYNANVNFRGNKEKTPLHLSAHRGNAEICTMLLNKGANVNAKQKDGTTALHIAAHRGHKDFVKVLLEHGANVESKMESGFIPQHLAVKKGNEEIIETPLKCGADIDSTVEDGRTPLHLASLTGNDEVVETLLEYGSDINITCKSGWTPLDHAQAGISSPPCVIITCSSDDDDYDYDRYGYLRELTAFSLKRHIVKMKTANLYVSEQNLQSMSSRLELSRFQGECEEEIARMKNENINNHNISFYDILAKDTSSLAICMRNENIVQVLKSGLYKIDFPKYATMIECHFRKAIERKELFEQGTKSFHFLFNNFPKLPYDCIEKVFNCLSNEDLKNLLDACKPLSISTPNTNIMQ